MQNAETLLSLNIFSPLVLLPTLLVGGLVYAIHKFTTRISPNIPYAGEESLSARLSVPVEYGKDPVEFLRKTRRKLGDVFCVDLFAAKIVFLLGAEGNKTVLRAAEDKLSFVEAIRWVMGVTIEGTLDDPDWVAVSFKMGKYSLQNQGRLESYVDWCSKITEEHFDEWVAKGTVPLFKSISRLVISCMLTILVGEEFYRKHGDELFPLMSQFERDLQHPLLRILPSSLWKYSTPGRALYNTRKRFSELIDAELKDILNNPEKNKGRGDYLYYIASQIGDRFAKLYGTHIMVMTFAGHANAAMTIPWLFLHARRTPGALERIREEADQARDARKPYTEACFRETGRLYTNISIMRMTKGTTTIAGHPIPSGTLISCSPLATQREDSLADRKHGIYTEGDRWNPDRFLSPDPNAYANWFQKAEFVHFGLGTHACPGEKFARTLILDLILKVWMEKYEVDVVSGLEEDVKGVDGVGAEGAWVEENMGTPCIRGEDVIVSVRRR